jgi:single-stranded-DNA-specific exonuclease
VISFNKDGVGKGSARSVAGLHLGQFFDATKEAGIIVQGGGHARAGGFTINRDKLADFNSWINAHVDSDFINSLNIDCVLTEKSNLNKVSRELESIEPYG